MTPELLAMIKDVPAATDEYLERLSRYIDGESDVIQNTILSLIARIVAERKEIDAWRSLVKAERTRAERAEAALSALEGR